MSGPIRCRFRGVCSCYTFLRGLRSFFGSRCSGGAHEDALVAANWVCILAAMVLNRDRIGYTRYDYKS